MTWPGWSAWAPVEGWPAVSPEVLAETLDGGQAFRWRAQEDGSWLGGWDGQLVRLRLGSDERVRWSAPASLVAGTPAALASYSLSMMPGSTMLFIFAQTPDGRPAFAAAISVSISSERCARMLSGDMVIMSSRSGST